MKAIDELSGVSEGDMPRQQANESTEPLAGRLGAAVWRTARTVRISRYAVKSRCACEWGAWGQVSVDGVGHYNPDRSEDPWGRAANAARTVVHGAPRTRAQTRDTTLQVAGCTKGGCKLCDAINS